MYQKLETPLKKNTTYKLTLQNILIVISLFWFNGCISQNVNDKPVVYQESYDEVKINTLVLYSLSVVNKYSGDQETYLNHVLAVTNEIFSNSKTNTHFDVVKIAFLAEINDATTPIETLDVLRTNSNILAMRKNTRADEVLIYRDYYGGKGACGIGYQNTNLQKEYAYAVMGVECETSSTAHEIGHNFGNSHSHLQDQAEGAVYNGYATGHIVENNFGTVMTYAHSFNADAKYLFSNPSLICNGEPCGVEAGEAGEADASRKIREVKKTISNFY